MPQSTTEMLKCWNKAGGSARQKKWCKSIPACIWWTVWKERNARCFEDSSSYTDRIKMNCVVSLYFWCKENLIEDAESLLFC